MPPISTTHVVLLLSGNLSKPNCNSKMVAASAAAAAVPCRSACLYSYWHTRKCSYHHLSCTCLRLHTGCCRTLLRDRTLAHSSLLHMCSCSCHHLRRTQSPAGKAAFGESLLTQNKKCDVCGKTVYQMEFVGASGRALHKNCFRCKTCNGKLKADSYCTSGNDVFYCKTHYTEAFNKSGTFDFKTSPNKAPTEASA